MCSHSSSHHFSMTELGYPNTSPQTQSLFTAEILEQILLRLDTRTLLIAAQRTCRFWTSLIRKSPSIQKALFFVPNGHNTKGYNPVLAEKFPTFFPQHFPQEELESEETIEEQVRRFYREAKKDTSFFNFRSILSSTFPSLYVQEDSTNARPVAEAKPRKKIFFTYSTFDMIQNPERLEAYTRKEASWRHMLIQQPPIKEFAFFTTSTSLGGTHWERHRVRVSRLY